MFLLVWPWRLVENWTRRCDLSSRVAHGSPLQKNSEAKRRILNLKYNAFGKQLGVGENNIPSKWKKWFNCLLAFCGGSICKSSGGSRRVVTGFWMLRARRQVGHDVSCSNQDWRHVLQKKLNHVLLLKFNSIKNWMDLTKNCIH